MALRKVNHLSDADHKIVTDAVAAAEQHTSGEIVTIVTDISDHYHDISIAWATAMAFLALAVIAVFPAFYIDLLNWIMGGWDHEYSAGEYLAFIFVVMALKWIGVWLVMKWMPLRMTLTPKRIKLARVRERAISMFKVGTESKTLGRTGVLLYLSMKEHRAEIVADEAIASKVDPAVWGDAMIALLTQVKAGRPGEGMAAAVEQMGVVLAKHFPKGSENPNELPDRLIEL
jgi:putative membrane protein